MTKKYTDAVWGINIPSFDGAERCSEVVKFANKQDDKQWDVVTFENMGSSKVIEKYFHLRKYVA